MTLIAVEADKCTHCGNCLDECPFRLLEMRTGDGLPVPREIPVRSAQERCVNCGHCVAVCPTGALTLHAAPYTYPGFPPPARMPVILCAGQVSRRDLLEPLRAAGCSVHLVGGAEKAAELDAKFAIDQASRLAARI